MKKRLGSSIMQAQFDCTCISWYLLINQELRKKLETAKRNLSTSAYVLMLDIII